MATPTKQLHLRIPANIEKELRSQWAETFAEHQIGSFSTWLVKVPLFQWLAQRDAPRRKR